MVPSPPRISIRKPLTPRSALPRSPPAPHPFNTVSTGDRKNGYPDMTVAQLSDALDARYAAKKLPAERHVQQLMAKVATAEDASLAAATLARFHHHRAAAFASMNLPRSRHGLTPQSLMMFIGACHRGGNVEAAMSAAENHNALGLPMTRPALVKLTQLCEDAGQVLRVYELWQKEGWDVDGAIAEAVVIAAARVGEPDAAERWLDEFKAAGIDAFDFSKCEAAVADKRAEMAPPATDDDVNPSDGGEENGETEEDGHDASQGENESK